jgi:hypothetical protein
MPMSLEEIAARLDETHKSVTEMTVQLVRAFGGEAAIENMRYQFCNADGVNIPTLDVLAAELRAHQE